MPGRNRLIIIIGSWSGLTLQAAIFFPPPVKWGVCNPNSFGDYNNVLYFVPLHCTSQYFLPGEASDHRQLPKRVGLTGPKMLLVKEGEGTESAEKRLQRRTAKARNHLWREKECGKRSLVL